MPQENLLQLLRETVDILEQLQTQNPDDITSAVFSAPDIASRSSVERNALYRAKRNALVFFDSVLSATSKLDERVSAFRQDVEARKEKYRMALCPVHLLPPEVLRAIFLIIVEPTEFVEPPHAVTISHVCRDWRDVALNQRGLWTHINILRPRELLQLYYTRSKDAALGLVYNNTPIDRRSPSDWPVETTPMIHADDFIRWNLGNRISYIYIVKWGATDPDNLSYIFPPNVQLSQLTRVSSRPRSLWRGLDENPQFTNPLITFTAPCLHQWEWSWYATGLPRVVPFGAQITKIIIRIVGGRADPQSLSAFFSSCPNVVDLEIHGTFGALESRFGQEPIVELVRLPRLQKLFMRGLGDMSTTRALRFMRIPKLAQLELSHIEYKGKGWDERDGFVRPTHHWDLRKHLHGEVEYPSLTTLKLEGNHKNLYENVELLRCDTNHSCCGQTRLLPQLRNLEVRSYDRWGDLDGEIYLDSHNEGKEVLAQQRSFLGQQLSALFQERAEKGASILERLVLPSCLMPFTSAATEWAVSVEWDWCFCHEVERDLDQWWVDHPNGDERSTTRSRSSSMDSSSSNFS